MKPIFIIEHLEPKLWPWCLIEYESISKIIGKYRLWFTNIKNKNEARKLSKLGKVLSESIRDLEIDMARACILEPLAPKTLFPIDKNKFQYFIFGGILGEEKLNGRTMRELSRFLKKAEKRNIGEGQFSTDNAVYVTNEIVSGVKLEDIPMKDTIEIKINSIESVILPYRYPIVKGKPRISSKLIAYLKNKKGF